MKTTPEQLAELKALKMPAWLARKDDAWAHKVDTAVRSLLADLEEATATLSAQKTELYEQQKYILELESELAATRQQLSEANQIKETVIAERADWMRAAYDLLEAIGEQLPPGASPRDVADRGVAQARSLRQQLEKAESIALDRFEAANFWYKKFYAMKKQPAYQHMLELEQQLAEAQAKNAELLQYFFSVESEIGSHLPTCALKAIALAKRASDTTALSAVITKAVEPYKRDAERYRYGKSKGYSFVRTSDDDYIFWLCEEEIDAAISAKEST